MIRRATIQDRDLINSIFNHEAVRDHIWDDSSKNSFPLDFGPILNMQGDLHYILTDGEQCAFMLLHSNGITRDVHSAILPSARGKRAIELGKESIQWVWDNTPVRKLMTWIPAYNTPAYAFARRCGFEIEGRLTDSWQKDGKLYDQILCGLRKGE